VLLDFVWNCYQFLLYVLFGIFMDSYSDTVVIGYGGIVTVCDTLGLVSLMVGLMWLMCHGQHADVWIFNSRT
jgi:hypothetical protein